LCGRFVQELVGGGASSSVAAALPASSLLCWRSSSRSSAGLGHLLQRYGVCWGCCAGLVAGSCSLSPRRRGSPMAGADPGAAEVGAWPRSMYDRRWPFLLRLLRKPVCDGTSPAHGGGRFFLRWRWPAMRRTTTEDSGRIQGFFCNFLVV